MKKIIFCLCLFFIIVNIYGSFANETINNDNIAEDILIKDNIKSRIGVSLGSGIYNNKSYRNSWDLSLFIERRFYHFFFRFDFGLINHIRTKDEVIYSNQYGFDYNNTNFATGGELTEHWGDFDLFSFDIGYNINEYISTFINFGISYYGKFKLCSKDNENCDSYNENGTIKDDNVNNTEFYNDRYTPEHWGDFDLFSFDIGYNINEYISTFINFGISIYGDLKLCNNNDENCNEYNDNVSKNGNVNIARFTTIGAGVQYYINDKLSLRLAYIMRRTPNSIYKRIYSNEKIDKRVRGVNISIAYGIDNVDNNKKQQEQ